MEYKIYRSIHLQSKGGNASVGRSVSILFNPPPPPPPYPSPFKSERIDWILCPSSGFELCVCDGRPWPVALVFILLFGGVRTCVVVAGGRAALFFINQNVILQEEDEEEEMGVGGRNTAINI